ncbi:glycoside hydrolase family 130 protein [Caldinitratiruptor microaerophilus]|uniref:Glycosidase n=1 Tax=Caldinitratiruptor microaerophilus TaxID=671077 RepID=A0AA35CJZ1_9FIRM|nr:glycosidase [Caldinitratiruptor microaerophilus]BDG60675.1 glycosidase [Caldinitratiruptor microaerophilus]
MFKLERLSKQPVLKPIPEHPWESAAVFNCAAIYWEGRIHLIYRATDIGPHARYGRYVSSLGYAVSDDGLHFKRLDRPILPPGEVPQEQRGAEDPRLVRLNGSFFLVYTAYGGRFEGDWRISLASSRELTRWQRHGVVLDEPNKDASLFPEKVGGRYVMLHRRYPDIWVGFSEDLRHWTDHQSIMSPRPGMWDSARIGIAGPPIRVRQGWLLLYHGADHENVYRLGAALLDPRDPTRVLARQDEPILEPELEWEREGWVPNVVFSAGQAEVGDSIYVYYGGADTVIGVAKVDRDAIRF